MKNLFSALALSFVCLTATWSQVPTAGLVAYYPFNSNANDQSGNGNDGTVNAAILSTDRFGNCSGAYNFTYAGQEINFGSGTTLNDLSPSISLQAWVRFNIDPYTVSGTADFVFKELAWRLYYVRYDQPMAGDQANQFTLDIWEQQGVSTTGIIWQAGRWYHIVAEIVPFLVESRQALRC